MALTYNDIPLSDCLTKTNVMGPVKDPSGSDQLYTKIHISAQAVLNAKMLPATVMDATASSPPSVILARIRHMLTQPRRSLYYDLTSAPGKTGDSPIIDLPGGRDDATGPWPDEDAISVTYTTPNTIEVVWGCTVYLTDCGASSPKEPLSLRWEDSLSWDESWKCTYTRVGTLIISSRGEHNVDWFRRNKIAPVVCAGFKRTSSRYQISRDGLRCDFQFTDEQIRYAPPYPSVRMKIVQSETVPLVGGLRKGRVGVMMAGVQNANITDLARIAMVIMKSRVFAANPLNAKGTVLGTAVLETTEDETSCSVSATCEYKVQGDKNRDKGVEQKRSWGDRALGAILNPGTEIGQALGDALTGGLTPGPTQPGGTRGVLQSNTPSTAPATNSAAANGRTQQGLSTNGTATFPWVGYGTGRDGNYADWANPTGSITGPADGVGLAPSVALFAAMLSDPCGAELRAQPTGGLGEVDIRTSPDSYNTPEGGQGGPTTIKTSQLSASLTALNASQYPSTEQATDSQALTVAQAAPGVYDHWQCLNEYENDTGMVVLPQSNINGINAPIALRSRQTTLYRRWSAKREGSPPAIPPTVVNKITGELDPNWIYVGGPSPQCRELNVAGDGVSIIYEASGVYIFKAINAALTQPVSEIPPFYDQKVMKSVQSWPSVVTVLANNNVRAQGQTQAEPPTPQQLQTLTQGGSGSGGTTVTGGGGDWSGNPSAGGNGTGRWNPGSSALQNLLWSVIYPAQDLVSSISGGLNDLATTWGQAVTPGPSAPTLFGEGTVFGGVTNGNASNFYDPDAPPNIPGLTSPN